MDIVLPLHVSLAGLAFFLFVWRGVQMWRNTPVQNVIWRRVIPDSIDTFLLLTGIAMLVMLELNPLHQHWLLAKLTAVLAFIGLGFAALHPGSRQKFRRVAFVAALISFGYIVAVARSKAIWF